MIDDANEAFLNHEYRDVCFGLCTAERIYNKSGQIVKVVVISNNQNEQAMLGDLCKLGNERLKKQITSRFCSAMYPLSLGFCIDFSVQNSG